MEMVKTRKPFWTGPKAFVALIVLIVLGMVSIPVGKSVAQRYERVGHSDLERAFRLAQNYPRVAKMVKDYTADGELLRWEMDRIEALTDRCYAEIQATKVKRLSESLE